MPPKPILRQPVIINGSSMLVFNLAVLAGLLLQKRAVYLLAAVGLAGLFVFQAVNAGHHPGVGALPGSCANLDPTLYNQLQPRIVSLLCMYNPGKIDPFCFRR
jgi:hypothetical protein